MNVDSLLNLISGTAGVITVLVVMLALILADRLHTHGEFERLQKSNEKKDETIEELTRALDAASTRADAAVKALEIMADAFTTPRTSRRKRVSPSPP